MAPVGSIEQSRIAVKLPDLFQSFLKIEPILNPLYESIRRESEETVCRECEVDAHVAKAIEKCDFSYFGAVMAPFADVESFRTIYDWGNWIFPFDDLFDISTLRADYSGASRTINQLLAGFVKSEDVDTDLMPPIVTFHDDIWTRIRNRASSGVQERYAKAMSDYCAGALAQVLQLDDNNHHLAPPSADTMLTLRRSSVCVASLFALVEYGHALDLPEEVFAAPAISRLEQAGIDLTLMHNDILSYHREEGEGVRHNLVAVARMCGMSAQAAFDSIADLIEARHQDLEQAIADLPSWNAEVDAEVQRYVRAVGDVVKANLWWSFRSGRFLGEEQKREVLAEGRLWVLERPAFLCEVGSEVDGGRAGVEKVGVRVRVESVEGDEEGECLVTAA